MKAKESFLPQSMRSVFHEIYIYLIGICVVCVSVWLIIALFFYNSTLSGFGIFGTFGEHYYTGKIIGFIKYVIGFIPELFLFMCLGRFGLSLLSSNITKESAPEYNFLRGFVALCFGVSGLGLISKSGCWGGYAGAVVYADIVSLVPKFVLPIGILFIVLFVWLSAKLLHIKLSHLIAISKTVWNITKWVLSVFHLTTPPENIISKPDEVEDIVPEKIIKPLRRRKKRNTETEQTISTDFEYELPPPELLEKSDFGKNVVTPEFRQTAILLQEHFEEYNIFGKVVGIKPGPIVTQYEFEREPGTRVAKFEELSRDMALAMGTEKIRISPISGSIYIGIEMRNRQPQTIKYQTIISNPSFVDSKFSIPLALGVNISGEPMYYDLAKMPHMLIA
ncbi:MAG: hypothetical protein MJ158_04035, partial [Alphaproteobacteria bacterium]|nr:hypothetical protein [Alphaproteobacteria bacterium]